MEAGGSSRRFRGDEESEEGRGPFNKGKGKEREWDAQGEGQADIKELSSPSVGDSIPRRIVNSASSLSGSLLGPPGHGEWTTATLGMDEKSGPSTGSLREKPAFANNWRPMAQAGSPHISGQRQDAGPDFESFLGRNMPTTVADFHSQVELRRAATRTVDEQDRRDGDEVVAILGQPHLLQDGDDFEGEDFTLPPSDARRLRAALFPDGAAAEPKWDHLLNFWPIAPDVSRTSDDGDGDAFATRVAWLEQWKDVLFRYTDEVWGDLASTAEEARAEVVAAEEAEVDKTRPNLAALGRLRMLLSHLRGH